MMTSLLQFLCVLSALVASGYALSCTECVSPLDSCTGPSVTCPSGSVCGAVYTQSWAFGILASKSYVMSCTPQNQCDKSGSMSLPHGVRMKIGISCCETDGCTPTFPSLPRDSSRYNGVTCQSCMSADSTWCSTSDTMQCTGEENTCLLQTTKLSGSKELATAMRGCATKSICDLASYSGSAMEVKFVCTSGSTGLQRGFYLPAVICIFFLKLLI
ncbi:phospholipase A2 inhibitor and Ly6/PLAUR domain-containing protein-like [Lithobates pipiens]